MFWSLTQERTGLAEPQECCAHRQNLPGRSGNDMSANRIFIASDATRCKSSGVLRRESE